MSIVRGARPDDAASIAAIYSHHVTHGSASFDTEAPSIEQTQAKIIRILTAGWPFLVAERDGAVVGYAYAAQFRDRPAYAYSCENSVYVHAEHLRCGIGRMLLNNLLHEAEAFGFRQMVAVIGGGEPGSVLLHEGLGFHHAGRMRSVGHKQGRWLDTVYMQHPLGKGDADDPESINRRQDV